MDPHRILEAVAEAYASCSTYRDSGQVTTRYLHPEGQPSRTSTRPFSTAFRRPDRFRFEFRSRHCIEGEWKRYIIWADGPAVQTWWDVNPGRKQPPSLARALGAAAGVSGLSAHTVPALLMPDRVRRSWLTALVDLASIEDALLGDVACYRLSGRIRPRSVAPAELEGRSKDLLASPGRMEPAEHSPVTVWIDGNGLLVRRIEYARQYQTYRTEHVTEYTPAVGVDLSDEDLSFGAPEAAYN